MILRKWVLVVGLGLGLAAFASAENSFASLFSTVSMSAGIKDTLTEGSGSKWADDFDNDSNRDNPNFGGGFGLFGKASFGSGSVRFMNQLEVDLFFNNGVGNSIYNLYDSDDEKGYVSVITLDIPLLFGLDIDVGKWTLSPYIGPYLSVPLAGTLTLAGEDYNLSCAGVNVGGTVGFGANYPLGPGRIGLDGRYAFDFTETKMKSDDFDDTETLFRRAGIQVSVSYVMQL